MAYTEVLIPILVSVLILLLIAFSFLMGKGTGEEAGYTDAYNDGYSIGYLEGMKEGFKAYKEVDESIFKREEERNKAVLSEVQETTAKLNEVLQEIDEFPEELLLAYSVNKIDDLPSVVKEAYNIKSRVGGDTNG